MNRQITTLALSFFLASCSQHADPVQLVLEFQETKNEGNVDATLDMFTENATLHFGPLGSITGLENIRGILEYDLAIETKLHFENCQIVESEVACRTTETNDWLRLADIESITYDESRFTFTSDGRIESTAATMSPDSAAAIGIAMANFDVWARANQPDEYAALFRQDGAFDYSYESGERVLELLRQWRSE